jgi:gamma-glutamyl hercynylcysteine S-oxide synthase
VIEARERLVAKSYAPSATAFAKTRAMSLGARLEADDGWRLVDGEGFTLRVDGERQSPLAFARAVVAGLDARPRSLDSSFLYDAAGSELFERITEQPEYYLTRAEDRLLAEHAGTIRDVAGSSELVELGSGSSQKTARLLDAWTEAGPTIYVPVDVDADAIARASRALARRYVGTCFAIRGIAATYERALSTLRGAEPLTLALLGSTLGNLGRSEYPEFCARVANALRPGDHFLVGLDLVKDPARLEAAYNDEAGVTAAFTQNLFERMNRELGSNVPAGALEHVAYYDIERERIEIFAEACVAFTLDVPVLGRSFQIARGERIHTEVSYKFRPAPFIALVERHGLHAVWHALGDGDFGLFLLQKARAPQRIRAVPDEHVRLLAELERTRERTLALMAPLRPSDLTTQHSPLMSPLAWDLGHIAEFEAEWLAPELEREAQVRALYDPQATPRAERHRLALPPVRDVFERLRRVRAEVRHRFASTASEPTRGLPAGGFSLPLVIQHELQHQETLLQALALREDLVYRAELSGPPREASSPPSMAHVAISATGRVRIPGGTFTMGTDDRSWAYDNERPAHAREVAEFSLDRCPVTNGAFFAFMLDRGYRRRELWTNAGWAWVEATSASMPLHWRSQDSDPRALEACRALVFGRFEPLAPNDIVSHVSWYEADAYARWAGGRLPTEAEWEKAAAWDAHAGRSRRYPWGDAPWQEARANLGQTQWAPALAGSYPAGESAYGCLGLAGDVWEWTDSWFDGYPGFESFPYPEYSAVFFGEHYRVLRGGAFATSPLVARTTFRNWDLPERRQIFAGFRCAWPA